MPRGRMVISEQGGRGTVTAVWEAHGGALGLFATKERNEIMRDAMISGGDFWSKFFLPMRFSRYAETLGYRPSSNWAVRKQKMGAGDTPLVFTNTLKEAAMKGVKIEARATANKQAVYIRIPIGDHGGKPNAQGRRTAYGIAPMVTAVLKSFPLNELKAVSRVIEKALIAAIGNRLEQRMNMPDPGPKRADPRARDKHGRFLGRRAA